MKRYVLLMFCFEIMFGYAQDSFQFDVEIKPVDVPNLQGLHSYAFAQKNGKWLVIGGRTDGLHARQPMNAFPQSKSNRDIYVIDIHAKNFWTSSVDSLPPGLKEQLQSPNMNFYQDDDTLFIIGGYAYSESAGNHKTFSNLTSVQISPLIDAVINGHSIAPFFKQISDTAFAITGGQIGKLNNTFYLVGGHRFDGRYNAMGNPTYTQQYSNQIRKFKINNSGNQLSFSSYSTITDPVHLRRRDYNLLPQIFPDGNEGYTVSSGVFQQTSDLPFLYPVDIDTSVHKPNASFNQYLSNYHSAKVCVFDSVNNQMHNLFLGGMSQYYYQNNTLVQDNNVPFVKTISRLSRYSDGSLLEYQLPVEMPGLMGASAEFFYNFSLPRYPSGVIKLSGITTDTILLGHIFGGIYSTTLNPFSSNQTANTSADNSVFEVRLIRNVSAKSFSIEGSNPYTLKVYPNPVSSDITFEFFSRESVPVHYFISNTRGEIVSHEVLTKTQVGMNHYRVKLKESIPSQILFLTVVIDNKFSTSHTIMRR